MDEPISKEKRYYSNNLKSFKINNLNVCKDKGGHKNNEIWTEGNETITDVYKILETSEMNKQLLE